MTDKELLTRAMHFEEVPRVPVVTMSGVTWGVNQAGLSPAQLMARDDYGAGVILDTRDRLDVDIVYGGRAVPGIILEAMGGTLDNTIVGRPSICTKTPLQEIEEAADWTPQQVMDRLHADPLYQALLRQTSIVKEKTGEERFVGVGSFGPFTTAAQMLGVSNFMTYVCDEDYEEEMKTLLDLSYEVTVQVTADALEAGGNLIFIAEPVSSGDMISEADFEKWSLPYLEKLYDRLRGITPYMILHICGKSMQRVPALAQSGITVFSMDGKGQSLREAMDLADGKITIMGNLNPVEVLERDTPEHIYALSRELIDTAGFHGGFLLSPGCDLTPDTPYENIHAMVQAALDDRNVV